MLGVSEATPLFTGLEQAQEKPRTRWFSDRGCLVEDGDERHVFVSGVLVSSFEVGDGFARDVVMVGLLAGGGQHVGRLARAFGVTETTVFNVRRKHAEGGLQALIRKRPTPPRKQPKLAPQQRRTLERHFDKGKRVSEVLEYAEQKFGIKRSTVYGVWRQWKARKSAEQAKTDVGAPAAEGQLELGESSREDEPKSERAVDGDEDRGTDASTSEPSMVMELPTEPADAQQAAEQAWDIEVACDIVDAPSNVSDVETGGAWEDVSADAAVQSTVSDDAQVVVEPESPVAQNDVPLEHGTTHHVQHVGTWLMLAGLMQLGFYDVVMRTVSAQRVSTRSLRLVLDALVMALALGERCVEGVRRLATPTSSVLLRATAAPSATWVRSVLGRAAKTFASVQEAMTMQYLATATLGEHAVFYVDNHMRPYAGKHALRRGWRMQDKRVLPGTSDYYVHDVDGRPVLRVTEPSHGHLTDFLRPLADKLRRALGEGVQIVLAFDRGGAFAETLAELRNAGIHFVTYERRPYPMLSPSVFEPDHAVKIGDEVYTIYEHRQRNLSKGRGRVRRIAVLTPKGTQINLLAISDLPAARLLEIMIGRWRQENGFKHGNERWGINNLDGRNVTDYAPDTVIPNPARRRLDHALRIARVREGDARRKLAELVDRTDVEAKRAKLEQELADALREQRDLLAQRPQAPKYIELANSELAGKLVHHVPEYKGLVDVVRIACANVESELAAMLAPLLPRPREAKKVLANLFAAPGSVRVSQRTIRVTLEPAATNGERQALTALVEQLDDAKLTLPGDPRQRRLRFQIAN